MPEQMGKFRASGLAKYFHHCEVMENKDEKNYLELAAKHDLEPQQLLMIGNSVKSDIAPVVNVGGWAVHTPHDVVWVHEMMDMPESDRIIEVDEIRDIFNLPPLPDGNGQVFPHRGEYYYSPADGLPANAEEKENGGN